VSSESHRRGSAVDPAAFFGSSTLEVARRLIGAILHVRSADGIQVAGRIVEVEAYRGEDDPASHAWRGPTPRSAIMFGPPAVAYVYLIYGMHHCLNFVCEPAGTPGAVLIRALEPVHGREQMALRRGRGGRSGTERDLCTGPGRLCQALGIDLGWNGMALSAGNVEIAPDRPGRIWLVRPAEPGPEVCATTRIGIRRGTELAYRFVDTHSACLSR